VRDEFDRQVETLVRNGWAALDFAPLRERLPERSSYRRIPFVIVVRTAPERALSLVESAFTEMDADDLDRFGPIEGVELPPGPAYLVTDVDTGHETLNVTPDDALERIGRAGRWPVTIEEGIALLTHYPEVLRTENAFSLLGSRCGDRRVTALWLSRGRPRLGWCWAGNPHTWLGSASCGARMGAS
jgi:hypothetical protein